MQFGTDNRQVDSIRRGSNFNLAVLTACEFLFTATLAISNTLSSIVGKTLITDSRFATAPYAIMTLLAALTTIGASILMRRVGRSKGFAAGAFAAVCGGGLATVAIFTHDFWLFCAGLGLIGVFKAFAQYYRFAAAEVVEVGNDGLKSKAVSIVLVGSFIAALSGPWFGAFFKNSIPSKPFAGSFLIIAGMGVISMAFVLTMRIKATTPSKDFKRIKVKLSKVCSTGLFITASSSATIGYSTMSFTMVTAPLALIAHNYSISDVAFIMQLHVAGMYGPSFFTGKVIARYGARRVIRVGCVAQAIGALVAMSSLNLAAFAVSLFLCGVGWNFMYVGSTVMLASLQNDQERITAQGANEFIMFSTVTACSLASASLLTRFGWQGIQIFTLIPLAVAFVVTLVREALPKHSRAM